MKKESLKEIIDEEDRKGKRKETFEHALEQLKDIYDELWDINPRPEGLRGIRKMINSLEKELGYLESEPPIEEQWDYVIKRNQ